MPRNLGKALERLLGPHKDGRMCTHQLYKNRGLAMIRKIDVPMVKNQVTGQWTFAQRTWFDYDGCLKGGRYLGMEAKEIGSDQLPIGASGLKPHQLEALINFHAMGAVTGVLWMPDRDRCYWLSGEFLKRFKDLFYEKPYKYIPLRTVEVTCPQVMTKDGFIDYLPSALTVVGP
ncbi:MAG: Holliday junction resolvase RecU [Armatimonadia bacterium]